MAKDSSASSLARKVQIEVFGTDLDGYQFIEQTRTLTITRDGATIPLANKLAPESELIVRNPKSNQEAVARVVDLVRDEVYVRVYGIAFVDPSVNLWQVELPEIRSKESMLMQCSRCHLVEDVLLSEIETEVFEAKQSLTRQCKCSDSSTIWKQADGSAAARMAEAREANDRKQKSPAIVQTVAPVRSERRKQKRTAMKTTACIRCYGGEEVVECEDVSRGGFRFKSREAYPTGSPIQAAILYTKSSGDLFVAARIVYKQKLDNGSYSHGVAFATSIERP
jgi:hypothetical protein